LLRNTFVHVPGISEQVERKLWARGCHDWDCLLESGSELDFGEAKPENVRRYIARSRNALESGQHQFFRKGLGLQHAWRAFEAFRHSCVYLDIETDGGQRHDCITGIGMYDGSEFRCLLRGQDLENFRDVISHYSMIVTFHGSAFDLRALQKRFFGLRFDQIHLDLCPTLRQLGLKGGLKAVEKELGIQRSPETDGLTGYDAVKLWRRYERFGDERALETFIAYNREDVVNMERLAEHAYRELSAKVRAGLQSALAL